MLEKKLEDRSVDKVEAVGGLAQKLVLLGLRGWPDRTILLPGGIIFFVEFKRERKGVVSAQQSKWAKLLIKLGFTIYTIDTDEDFDRALAEQIRPAREAAAIDRPSIQPQQRPRPFAGRRW